MINFFLPRLVDSYKINNYFKTISERKGILKDNINIAGVSGSFPYMYWNGSKNNNKGNGLLYDNITFLYNNLISPISIDCSNLLINSNDFFDTYSNTVLTVCHNGSNFLEVSNIDFLNYLHGKFPYYRFILSEQFFNLNKEADIEELLNLDYIKYYKCFINSSLLDLGIIKNKMLVCVNNYCIKCDNCYECSLRTQGAQYTYSTFDSQNVCEIFQKNYAFHEEKNKTDLLINKGIINFYIQDNFNSNLDYIIFLLNLFIPLEKYEQALDNLKSAGAI